MFVDACTHMQIHLQSHIHRDTPASKHKQTHTQAHNSLITSPHQTPAPRKAVRETRGLPGWKLHPRGQSPLTPCREEPTLPSPETLAPEQPPYSLRRPQAMHSPRLAVANFGAPAHHSYFFTLGYFISARALVASVCFSFRCWGHMLSTQSTRSTCKASHQTV